eukprot:1443454-Prymnesium_polylepis.1
MYEKAGLLTTTDGAFSFLAGACLGGGSTINWACCLPPPEGVRAEWADAEGVHQLPQFAPAGADGGKPGEFEASLEAVMKRISATTDGVVHNANNRTLIEGCDKLGYEWRTTAQNLRDTGARSAGWTCFGEKVANKQGGLATFLADAVLAGATIVDKCTVSHVLTEPVGDGPARRATGVEAILESGRRVQITARKAVVLAAGALHSPCVLQRSDIRLPHAGRHLRIHPVTGVLAQFEEREVVAYEAAPMTVVSDVAAAGPAGDGYGAKLECPSTHVGLMSAAVPWRSGVEFVRLLTEHRQLSCSIVLHRDGGGGDEGGRVTPNADGTPRVDYRLGAADHESMLDAQEKAIRCFVAAGCMTVSTLQNAVPMHYVMPCWRGKGAKEDGNEPLEAYLAAARAYGLPPNAAGLFSAHQMGTCRMGSSPETSVVDEDGEVWGVDGLVIADDSTFPSASGSNPMVTTLAMAHMISTRLVGRLANTKEARAAADERRQRRAIATDSFLRTLAQREAAWRYAYYAVCVGVTALVVNGGISWLGLDQPAA